MSNQTQEIPRDQWARFLDEFTREHRGSHARLEIIGGEAGAQVETENRQLDGAAADYKDGECTVWITFTSGAQPGEHLARGIHGVKAVRCLPVPMPSDAPARSIWMLGSTLAGASIAAQLGRLTHSSISALDLSSALQGVSFALFDLHLTGRRDAASLAPALASILGHAAIAIGLVFWRVRSAQQAGVGGSS